jgi:hypothetical protein
MMRMFENRCAGRNAGCGAWMRHLLLFSLLFCVIALVSHAAHPRAHWWPDKFGGNDGLQSAGRPSRCMAHRCAPGMVARRNRMFHASLMNFSSFAMTVAFPAR